MPKLREPENDKDDRSIVAKIKYGMEMTGISSQELALFARMDRATLYNRYKSPGDFRLKELRRISKKLHIPLNDLISENF